MPDKRCCCFVSSNGDDGAVLFDTGVAADDDLRMDVIVAVAEEDDSNCRDVVCIHAQEATASNKAAFQKYLHTRRQCDRIQRRVGAGVCDEIIIIVVVKN